MEGQLKIAYFSDLSENVQYISINQGGVHWQLGDSLKINQVWRLPVGWRFNLI